MARARIRPELEPGLRRLWAPWRAAYVAGARVSKGCIFCPGRLSRSARRERLVLYTSERAVVMLNLFPYNAGHLLVAPRRHCASPELLTSAEQLALTKTLTVSVKILRREFKPAGFNLGMNVGQAAGAGIASHIHWHVVPRWVGDTNFMPVVGAVRVISEHLESVFDRLEPLFNRLDPPLS